MITLLFFLVATLVPMYAHAAETVPATNGVQMSFSGSGTTYQTANLSLAVSIQSNKQIDSTSVKVRLDGQAMSSDFKYKGHWMFDEDEDEYWVLESELEGTVSTVAMNLKDGSHVLSVTAADITGVPVTKDWNFNVSVKPVFSNPSHTNGEDSNKNTGFSINVFDNDGIDVSSINMLFDGKLVPANYNSSTGILTYSPVSGISDGPHSVKITLKDISGNIATYNSNFTVCASGPSLTFGKAGQVLTSKQNLIVDIQSIIDLSSYGYTVKLNGQPINANFSYPKIRWDDDEEDWIVENYKVGRLSITPSSLKDGIQTLEVTAKDHLGTSTTQSWNFTVNINPEMGTPLPGNGSFTKDNTGFSLKITDDTAVNPNSIIATLDNEIVSLTFDSSTGIAKYYTNTPIKDGLHNVSVTAEDTAGNKSSYSWKYTILTVGPNMDLVQKNQTLTFIPELMINLNSDVDLSNSGYIFKVDGQQVNPQFQFKGHWDAEDEWSDLEWIVDSNKEGTLKFTPGNLSDGVHTIEVTAKDSIGNVTTKSWNFTISMKSFQMQTLLMDHR
jgi:hypothetical protein